MAIIQAPEGASLADTVFRFMLQKQQLEAQERAQRLREREFKLQEKEAAVQEAQAMGQVQNLLQAMIQGNAQAQAVGAETPGLRQGLRALGDARVDTTQALASFQAPGRRPSPTTPSQIEGARAQVQRAQTQEKTLSLLRREAHRLGDPSIVRRAEIAINLDSMGMDASTIKETLPPSAQELLELEKLRLGVQGLEDQREADVFATNWLQRQGIVPQGVMMIPDAAQTLLKVTEAREGKKIDWLQEGLDYITSRVGDSSSGSSFPFTIGPDGNLLPVASEGVEVGQAVAEWKAIVDSYAPSNIRERLSEQVGSGLFRRKLENTRAVLFARDILANAEDRRAAEEEVRSILEENFTPTEIQGILKQARQPRP